MATVTILSAERSARYHAHNGSVAANGALRRAFTLVELLVVMAIILVIAGLTLPALKGTFNGINLSGASDILTGQLLFARQAAVSRNLPVEVRIYQYDDGNGPAWNTIAVLIPGLAIGRTTDEWLEPAHTLGGNVIMDPTLSQAGDSFSTVIKKGNDNPVNLTATPNPTAPWKATEAATAPRTVRSLPYVAFRFMPDGSTNLPAQDSTGTLAWCLTLRNANIPASADRSVPATNYVAVVIDPFNGRASTYRP